MVDVLARVRRHLRGVQLLATVCVLTFSTLDTAAARTLATDGGVSAGSAPSANGRQQNCLATAIYFEARGESQLGQKAVAEVILARTRATDRPKTICGVVYEGARNGTRYCQFSFACDGISDKVRDRSSWSRAQKIASAIMRTGGKINAVVGNATYYPSLFRHSYFFQDRWRVTPGLTLSAGMRYEYFGTPMNVIVNPVYTGLFKRTP